jgi:hypothetical protein
MVYFGRKFYLKMMISLSHFKHIDEWAPNIKKYLGLPPGWRFLIAGDYEDVWFDPDIIIE